MTWVNLALVLLQIAQAIIDWARSRQSYDSGVDEQIAQATAAILVKTNAAKEVMKQVTGMTDAQVDEALKSLEP